MKQKVLLFLAALLLPVAANAYDTCINGIYYNIVKKAKQATVTYGDVELNNGHPITPSYEGDVIIPSTVEYDGVTCNVVEIGKDAFSNCSLESLTIPASVNAISSGPESVKSVYISDLTAWCNTLFSFAILNYAQHFYVNNRKITDLVIPNNVSTINPNAFAGAKMLISVTIPQGVNTIGLGSFAYCENLETVTIGNTVDSIGAYAFADCNNLKVVNISDIATWCGIRFGFCTNAYSEGLTVRSPAYKVRRLRKTYASAANPLENEKASLFLNGKEIIDLIIPDGVKKINPRTFLYYKKLRSVNISNSVESIGYEAFAGCKALTDVIFGNSVNIIGTGTRGNASGGLGTNIHGSFEGCTSLKSLVLPNSLKTIGEGSFVGCSGLTSVLIPNGVTTIGGEAFEGCSALVSVVIPNSVTCIRNWAFSGCSSLTSITLSNSLEIVEHSTFNNCSSLLSISIPNSVKEIESRAFYRCSGLKSVFLPNTIENIPQECFQNCSSLTSVIIPNNVYYIGYDAFKGCSALTTIVLGEKMGKDLSFTWMNGRNIADGAFENCKELTDVYCLATKVPGYGNYAFSGSMIEYATLHVKPNMIDDYKGSYLWGKFGTITSLKAGDPGFENPKGDVNGDFVVDVADIASVISVMASGSGIANPLQQAADVNGDGVVDVADIATIISEMATQARMQEEVTE